MLFTLFTILPFTSCLFWTMVLVLDWRRDNAAQHVLAVFMGVSAALYLCHAAFFNHAATVRTVSESIYAFCNIAVFPLYYLYICRLTDRRGLSARHLAILLPAVVIGLWATALNIFCPDNTSAESVRMLAMRIVFVVQLVPVCWIGYRRLRAFDREIANNYADTESRSVRPTSRMMGLLVGAALLSGLANYLGREFFDSSDLLLGVPSVLFTLLLFGVGYVGNRQEFCIDDLIRDENRYSDSGIEDLILLDETPDEIIDMQEDVQTAKAPGDETSQIIAHLDALMAESSLYLRADLRLSEVASMLGVGRTTLSQHINQELHLSFSDYINNLRIDHACRLLSDPQNKRMSLTGVAELSGFSSDSSFYRAFRRHTGKTPKQYLGSL